MDRYTSETVEIDPLEAEARGKMRAYDERKARQLLKIEENKLKVSSFYC